MPYVQQPQRDIVNPDIQILCDFINGWDKIDADRLAQVVRNFLVCVYQEHLPRKGRAWHTPVEAIIVSDLANTVLTNFETLDERAGVLNYCVTRIMIKTVMKEGVRYHRIQTVEETLSRSTDAVYHGWLKGVLGCVAREFYRRVAVKYEDMKIKENGDVFDVRD